MHSKKGYSLVELLMTFSLLTVLVVLISSSINLTKFMTIKNRNDSLNRMQVKNAMLSIVRDLREGISGYDSACATPLNPNNYCILDSSRRITFKVPENTANDGTTTYKTIDYTFNDSTKILTRSEVSSTGTQSTPIVISERLDSATYSRDSTNPNVVRIQIASANNEISDQTQVFLRNSR